MNQQAKRAIKSLVLALRHKLEDEIAVQLKRYGFAGGRWLPLERLPHIERDDRAASDYYRLQAALEQHLRRIGADPARATPQQRAEAADWFVREVAFTHLNRLVALKCLEVRGLIPEVVTTRDAYGGRSRAHYDYRHAHPDQARAPDDALPAAIRHACQGVYAEFRFLFDVGDPAVGRQPPANTILWPDYPTLKECIALINDLDHEAGHDTEHAPRHTLWAEDEIIGWLYQFYNAEHKEVVRKRGRPRRPAEVAVINQFFTPRWIVKFLVDNTLGRLWLEMHPDSHRVRAKCDYLVPEPLAGSESKIQNPKSKIVLDPDSPVNSPNAPARREPKRPQEIRLIDPACGTMHFGHYAFEVFQEIYHDFNELYAQEQGAGSPQSAIRIPKSEIPSAILRHNLYGVDIDLRAVQLAGLSLFIKAKSTEPKAHISHVNLAVADAVLPADGARRRFLDQYRDDRAVQDAVRQVLDEMANVAEVGSLLRVEERLRDLLGQAGHEAVRADEGRTTDDQTRQRSFGEIVSQPEEWGAHYTVARLLDDLRAFAAEALQTHDLNAQLFAQEAEKTVHLLDVFLNDYDVVVMNPPYGGTTSQGNLYLKTAYPETGNDLYAAFVERATELLGASGYAGALTSRTFLHLRTFSSLRQRLLGEYGGLITLAELGIGVLDDATVRPTAYIVRSPEEQSSNRIIFFGLRDADDRKRELEGALAEVRVDRAASDVFLVSRKTLDSLPGRVISYWVTDSLGALFDDFPPLDRDIAYQARSKVKIADVKAGLCTGQDAIFVRNWWELQPGRHEGWYPFNKGGSFGRYYSDIEWVVDWGNDGYVIRNLKKLHGLTGARVQNEQFYFLEGLSYPYISDKGLSVRHHPAGRIFSHGARGIFPHEGIDPWALMGILNSKLLEALLQTLTVDRKHETGIVSSLPIAIDIGKTENEVPRLAKSAHDLKAAWDTGNETCTRFDTPWLVQAHRGALLAGATAGLEIPNIGSPIPNLQSLLDHVRAVETAADARLGALQARIDEAVYDLYEISAEDRALIERELGDRPPELVWPQMENKSDKEKRREHVRRLVSYFLLQALKEKRDGVLPLTPGTGQPSALDEVRRCLEAEFGEVAAFRMEAEIRQVLGRDVESWLGRDFFAWHVKLYKRRPVVWHLVSPGESFACFVYLHKLDRDTLRKVQTLYLWPRRRAAETELASARAAQSPRRIGEAEAVLDDLAEFERRLLSVVQAEVACEVPDWAEGPFRDGVYDPALDDGVKVNIRPLQEAGLLRLRRVV